MPMGLHREHEVASSNLTGSRKSPVAQLDRAHVKRLITLLSEECSAPKFLTFNLWHPWIWDTLQDSPPRSEALASERTAPQAPACRIPIREAEPPGQCVPGLEPRNKLIARIRSWPINDNTSLPGNARWTLLRARRLLRRSVSAC